MKNFISKINFTELSTACLLIRLFVAGFTHAPVLFGTLGGIYAAIVAFKAVSPIALFISNKLKRQ